MKPRVRWAAARRALARRAAFGHARQKHEEQTMLRDHDANAHELLNEATEWLQYARNVTQMLAELVHESDTVDCARLSMTLEAIGAMTHRGIHCTAEAHARMHVEASLR